MKLSEALANHEQMISLMNRYAQEQKTIESSDSCQDYAEANPFGLTSDGWRRAIDNMEEWKSESMELMSTFGDIEKDDIDQFVERMEDDDRYDYDTQEKYCIFATHAKKYIDKFSR